MLCRDHGADEERTDFRADPDGEATPAKTESGASPGRPERKGSRASVASLVSTWNRQLNV